MTDSPAVTPPSAPLDPASQVAALEAENARLRQELADRAGQGLQPPDWPDHVWKQIGYSREEWMRNHPENAPPAMEHASGTFVAPVEAPPGQ